MRGVLRRRVGEADGPAGDPVKRALLIFLLGLAAFAGFAPAHADPAPPAPPHILAPAHPTGPVDDAPLPPAPEPPDRRPLYLAGGVVVLALVFWWNRDRARKLEREHGETPPRQRRWRVKPDDHDDDDSDALADAADDQPKDDKHD